MYTYYVNTYYVSISCIAHIHRPPGPLCSRLEAGGAPGPWPFFARNPAAGREHRWKVTNHGGYGRVGNDRFSWANKGGCFLNLQPLIVVLGAIE